NNKYIINKNKMYLEEILNGIGVPKNIIDEIILGNNSIDEEKIMVLVNNYLTIVSKNNDKIKMNNSNIIEKIVKIENIIEQENDLKNAEEIINNI
ncbi:MAG: hypothetical protein V3575_01555, partial [Candidatus Absconditabacteria bacterium]